MPSLIVIFSVLVILLGLFLFVRLVMKIAKGNCCEGCKQCRHKEACGQAQKNKNEKE